jgi:DNA-directed RNA polymerase specialized sigma24 family protein
MTGQPMPTDHDIQRLRKLAEDFDPSTTSGRDAADLRAIAETVDGIRAGEAKLRELVELARGHGRSWGEIAIALGVSRQAAHERFADKIHA